MHLGGNRANISHRYREGHQIRIKTGIRSSGMGSKSLGQNFNAAGIGLFFQILGVRSHAI